MIRALLICMTLGLSAGSALAQNNAPEPKELVALNFYVQQNDTAAVDAELRRLRVKYPDWEPPADLSRLSQTAPSREIDQIYRDISASRFKEARAGIAAAQAEFPDWTPPAELISLLNASEAQKEFERLLRAGQLSNLQDLAQRTPELMRCDRINNAWRLAEAQAQAGNKDNALSTYRAVANACVNPAEVAATLEKASALADAAVLAQMLADVEIRLPRHQARWSELRTKLLPGSQTAVEMTPNTVKTGPADKVVPAAKTPAAPVAPQAKAQPAAPSAPVSGGGGAMPAQLERALRAGDWRSCLALTQNAKQGQMIAQHGWCAYNLDQSMAAVTAFNKALKTNLDATQQRDAQYGLALAYLKLNMPNDAAKLAVRVNFTLEQRIEIEGQILNQRGINAYNRNEYKRAIEYFNAYEQVKNGIPRDLAELRAYAHLNLGQVIEARRQFEYLNNQMATDATRRGLAATRP